MNAPVSGGPRPLALFGGTFDPVHLGHLRVAWEAAQRLDADVRMMPANVPPHRPQPVASARQRLAILETSLSGQDRLTCDARELEREGRSYSIDTLIDVRREIGPRRPLLLLVGADAFAGLATWHRWRELFDHAHVGVLSRPDSPPITDLELIHETTRRGAEWEAVRDRAHGAIVRIAVTALSISATQVRQLVHEGQEPRFLVADRVLAEPGLLDPYRFSQ